MEATNTDRLAALMADIRRFVKERDWDQFHDPKNLTMAVASEAGELLAEFRWVHSTEADAVAAKPVKRQRVLNEIGDVAIALLCLCHRLDADLVEVVNLKLTANASKYPVDVSRGCPDPVA